MLLRQFMGKVIHAFKSTVDGPKRKYYIKGLNLYGKMILKCILHLDMLVFRVHYLGVG
jgi:hypothetical protein